jgi:NTE family protein
MQSLPFVLSGGGVRGAAHLGVLQACRERGIVPGAIAGTSAGALVGAMIADGRTPEEVLDLVRAELKRSNFIRRPGFASKRIEAFLARVLRRRQFEELPIPLFVSATDLEKGGQRIFHTGPLIPALMASCAIPVVFPPVLVEGTFYVDGGISNNLPVEPFQQQIGQVVCVHVNPLPPFVPGRRSMIRTMDRIWHLNFREMVMRSAQGCRLFIEPPELSRFNLFELGKLESIVEIGHRWTEHMLNAEERL